MLSRQRSAMSCIRYEATGRGACHHRGCCPHAMCQSLRERVGVAYCSALESIVNWQLPSKFCVKCELRCAFHGTLVLVPVLWTLDSGVCMKYISRKSWFPLGWLMLKIVLVGVSPFLLGLTTPTHCPFVQYTRSHTPVLGTGTSGSSSPLTVVSYHVQ